MSLLSPCESCTTFTGADNYSNKVFNTYLATRLSRSDCTNEELILYYKEEQIHVKILLVLNLVRSCLVDMRDTDLNINHLIAYIAFNQEKLHISSDTIYVNQIVLVHCGHKYSFQHSGELPKLLSLKNWDLSRAFHMQISDVKGSNIYRYFNLENYLAQLVQRKGTGWTDRLKQSLKKMRSGGRVHKTYRRDQGRNFVLEATEV